jgi:hypothetical protein
MGVCAHLVARHHAITKAGQLPRAPNHQASADRAWLTRPAKPSLFKKFPAQALSECDAHAPRDALSQRRQRQCRQQSAEHAAAAGSISIAVVVCMTCRETSARTTVAVALAAGREHITSGHVMGVPLRSYGPHHYVYSPRTTGLHRAYLSLVTAPLSHVYTHDRRFARLPSQLKTKRPLQGAPSDTEQLSARCSYSTGWGARESLMWATPYAVPCSVDSLESQGNVLSRFEDCHVTRKLILRLGQHTTRCRLRQTVGSWNRK